MALLISRFYDFTPGDTIRSAEVDAEFNQLVASLNIINKIVEDNVTTSTDAFTMNCDSYGEFSLTALSEECDFDVSGTPRHGQDIVLSLKDDGSAQTLNWDTVFSGVGYNLPDETIAGKWMYFGFKYHSTAAKWHLLAFNIET